jgi:uncharacterized peroxidase-related enzyme
MFLTESSSAESESYLERERAATGYVMNCERVWAWRPDVAEGFGRLRQQLMKQTSLTAREIALLTCTTVRVLGDSYCSLAWGTRLAALRGAADVATLLQGEDPLTSTSREVALRKWAEQVVRDPNGASAKQVEKLRAAGLSDQEIFEATVHIAFRLAFSAVNDALGAVPDREVVAAAPSEVVAAVTYGRWPGD